MNETLVAELEKLNQAYPFRVFELETLDGRRIRITKPFRKLWGAEEKKAGDIKIENALLRYDELKECIYFLPAWKRPLSWIYHHPGWLLTVIITFQLGTMGGCGMATWALRSTTTEQHK